MQRVEFVCDAGADEARSIIPYGSPKTNHLLAERQAKADAIGAFIFEVHKIGPILEFDDALWFKLIDHVTAYHDGRLVFNFTNGSDIEA